MGHDSRVSKLMCDEVVLLSITSAALGATMRLDTGMYTAMFSQIARSSERLATLDAAVRFDPTMGEHMGCKLLLLNE